MGGGQNEMEVVVSGDASGLNSALASGMSNIGSMKKKVAGLGVAMSALAAGGIAKSIGAASSLDSALTESQAIMGDLTQGEMADMETAARDVAKTTTFSAEQAGESFFYLASAGMDAEQSVSALPQVASFAQAGMFDMATATDLATDAQSALGMTSENAQENLEGLTRVTDVLVGANTLANASVEQFSSALTNKAGAALKSTNKDIEEGVSVLAAYADQGIKGKLAGERLNIVIRDLQKSAQENSKAFDEMGVSVFDAEGEMRPMHDIIRDVEQATQGMSTEQRNAALSTLGLSQQAMDGITPLLGMSDAIEDYEGELQNAKGTTDEIAQNQLKSFQAQLDILKSNITDVAIGIGQVFLPHLTRLVEKTTVAVQWFGKLSEKTQGTAAAVGLVATAIGGLLPALGLLSASVGPLVPTMISLGGAMASIATGPVTLLVGAIVGLAAAWRTNFAGIQDVTKRVLGPLNEEFQKTASLLTDLLQPALGSTGGAFGRFRDRAETALTPVITLLGDKLVAAIRVAGPKLRKGLKAAARAFAVFDTTVQSTLNGTIAFLEAQHDRIPTAITSPFWFAVAELQEGVQAAMQASARDIITGVVDTLDAQRDRIPAAITDPFWVAIADIKAFGPVAADAARTAFTTLLGAIHVVWDEGWTGVHQRLTTFFENATQEVETKGRTLQDTFRARISDLPAAANQHLGRVETITTGVFQRLPTPVRDGLTTMHETSTGLLGDIETLWDTHGGTVTGEVDDISTSIREDPVAAIETALGLIPGPLALFAESFVETFDEITENAIPHFEDAFADIGTAVQTAVEGDIQGGLDSLYEAFDSTLQGTRIMAVGDDGQSGVIGNLLENVRGSLEMAAEGIAKATTIGIEKPIISAFENVMIAAVGGVDGSGEGLVDKLIGEVANFFKSDALHLLANATGELVGKGILAVLREMSALVIGSDNSIIYRMWKQVGLYIRNDAADDIYEALFVFGSVFLSFFEGLYDELIGGSLIPDMFNDIAAFVASWFGTFNENVKSWLTSVWEKFVTFKDDTKTTIRQALTDIYTNAQTWFTGFIEDVSMWLTTTWEKFVTFKEDVKFEVWKALFDIYENAKSWFSGFIEDVKGWLTSLWEKFDTFRTDATDTISNMLTDLKTKAENWKGKFTKPFTDAADTVKEKFDWLKDVMVDNSVVPDMLGSLRTEAENWEGPFVKPFKDAADTVLTHFKDLETKLKGRISNIDDMVGGMKSGGGKLKKGAFRKRVGRMHGGQLAKWKNEWISKVLHTSKGFRKKFGITGPQGNVYHESLGRYANIRQEQALRVFKNQRGAVMDWLDRNAQRDYSQGGMFEQIWNKYKGTPLAHGGLVTGPTRALIGEGREDEAVLPLSKLNTMVERAARTGAQTATGGDTDGGGSSYEFHITIAANSEREGRLAGRGLTQELRSHNFN